MAKEKEISELKLEGYIDLGDFESGKIIFLIPFFKDQDNQNYYLDYFKTSTGYEYSPVILEADYFDNKVYDAKEKCSPTVSPFFAVKILDKIYCGTIYDILRELFNKNLPRDIYNIDEDFLLLDFMVRNNDDHFLINHYLIHFTKPRIKKMIIHLFNTDDLNDRNKRFFIHVLRKSDMNRENKVFKNFRPEDLEDMSAKLDDGIFKSDLLELIRDWLSIIDDEKNISYKREYDYEKKVKFLQSIGQSI